MQNQKSEPMPLSKRSKKKKKNRIHKIIELLQKTKYVK